MKLNKVTKNDTYEVLATLCRKLRLIRMSTSEYMRDHVTEFKNTSSN